MGEGVTQGTGPLRFDGRTVVVTGAGSGLGRAYALEYARRGASVVVNDLGVAVDGTGAGASAAAAVAAEIVAAGGRALASTDSVLEGERIVQVAVSAFGGIDVLVNNAGFIRDRSFARMTDEDWRAVCDVHLTGAWRTTQAAWKHMLPRQYGRIVFTSSAAGLYGNFGQANYAAAKLGLVGLMRTLAREGAAKNICSNAVAPMAATRFTSAVMPEHLIPRLRPEQVVPLVVFLGHERCTESGSVFEAGGGWFARARWQRSRGLRLHEAEAAGAEAIAAHWHEIVDFAGDADYPESAEDTLRRALGEAP